MVEEQIKKMDSLLNKMRTEKGNVKYTELNHTFHFCLIEMSRSGIFKKMYNQLKLPLLRIQHLSFTKEGKIEKSVNEHAIIIDFLRNNQVQEAPTVLNKHNYDVIESLQEELKKQGPIAINEESPFFFYCFGRQTTVLQFAEMKGGL